MADKNKRATFGRRIFISVALVALLGIFLSLYYFFYIPQQELVYNKGTFRILNEISDNFTARLLGNNNAVTTRKNSASVPNYAVLERKDLIYNSTTLQKKLMALEGRPEKNSFPDLINNKDSSSAKTLWDSDSARNEIARIFKPVMSIHTNTFESVVLIHLDKETEKIPRHGQLIYRSSDLSIDEEINIDSLYKRNSAFIFPIVNEINIGAADYKLYLFPFRIKHEKFLMGGFVSKHSFQIHTHNFPVGTLVLLGILLTSVLLSLPFLKIYLIGPQENISVRDVRSVIAMIYIIPFFMVLLGSGIWLQYTNNIQSNANLEMLSEQVKTTFYNEIKQTIRQLKYYDYLHNNPEQGFKNLLQNTDSNALSKSTVAFADEWFHPGLYKNFDGLFWINDKGEEIAKWNFVDSLPAFFDKNDRQYFQDIKNTPGYKIPGDTCTFSIQPTLAKSTGNYTISIAIKSNAAFTKDTAVLIGLHGKMYSVYKPVVPRGTNFCIINTAGDILYHSESDRSLQENLYDETDNINAIKVAVSHKEKLLLDNVNLYENNVKMLVKPIEGLHYFLVTYSNKKIDLLFVIHIVAFSFFCEGMLLLIVSLITLFYYHSNTRASKLFFVQNDLNFAKPSPHKTEYYKRILYYQSGIFLLMSIAFIFFNGRVLLSYVLYTSILLPLFSVIGYYLIRTVENYRDNLKQKQTMAEMPAGSGLAAIDNLSEHAAKTKSQQLVTLFTDRKFLSSLLRILAPYVFVIWIFFLIKSNVSHNYFFSGRTFINFIIVLFAIGFPLMAIYLSLLGLPRWMQVKKSWLKAEHKYLSYFVFAIMLSAILTCVMPTLGFILFAAGQEKSLQLKSRQIHLADKIMKHRKYINEKIADTKLVQGVLSKPARYGDSLYIDSLKFSPTMGIYAGSNNIRLQKSSFKKQDAFTNSQFYKQITQYLFLPTEHSDYFGNADGFFYWTATPVKQEKKDSLLFYYKNSVDKINNANIVIASALPHQPSFLSILKYRLGTIILLAVILLLITFYKIIYSASKRIFLIDYFDTTPGREQDTDYLDKEFFSKEDMTNKKFDKEFWQAEVLTLQLIKSKEKAYPTAGQNEESVLKIENLLAQQFENIWDSLTPTEQYVVYDFALDGFSNYKNVDILYSLYKKGILQKENNSFVMMTDSFRNYLIAKTGTDEINKLKHEISEGGTWGNLRTVLLIIIFLIVVFLFIVQEDVSKRVFAIITSVAASIPVILKLFERNVSGNSGAGDKNK